MAEPRTTRKTFGAHVRENIVSVVAIFVSVISLGVAVSSNRTQERLLAASAWPALEFGTGNRSDSGTDEITFVLGNNGVGPARLRGVRVFYRGDFAADSRRLMQRCCAAGDSPIIAVTSGTRGRVLKAGDRIVLMTLPTDNNSGELWQRLDRARSDVTVQVCYCSVLDDCWIFDSTRMDPEPVRSCPAVAAEEEWNG